jgi:hypothetical protein
MRMKRATAVRLNISDVVNAKFIPASNINPQSVIMTPDERVISRVMLLGRIEGNVFFDREAKFAAFTLADDTGEISCRLFRDGIAKAENITKGDLVKVVGKVRYYKKEGEDNGEIYVAPEVVRKVDDPLWTQVHNLEVKMCSNSHAHQNTPSKSASNTTAKQTTTPRRESAPTGAPSAEGNTKHEKKPEEKRQGKDDNQTSGAKEKVLELIQRLDDGSGVKYITLLNESGLPEEELENALAELLDEGEIYEPKIGRFRCT